MFKKMLALTTITAFVTMAVGCTGAPDLNQQWGKSVKTAKDLQIIKPEAERTKIQPPEMDGQSAGHAVESYRQSFKQMTAE
ncbi:MAG: hypothetical protein GY874_10400 [Desulfobacteraceae bacterium]|nr:hypothetical protein [Desulfobacteraceae bacterium]